MFMVDHTGSIIIRPFLPLYSFVHYRASIVLYYMLIFCSILLPNDMARVSRPEARLSSVSIVIGEAVLIVTEGIVAVAVPLVHAG